MAERKGDNQRLKMLYLVKIFSEESDDNHYLTMQLLDQIGANYHVPIDYIKSTPYLMSFMRDYQLKRNVENYFKKHPDEIRKINKDSFWLKRRNLDRYDKIPNNNARLERVMESVLQRGVLGLWRG